VPVPVRLAVWGLLVASSVTVNVPLRVPVAVGAKVTLMMQLVPAATLVPQLFVCPKSPLLVPVKAIFAMFNTTPLGLESVTACAVLVVPTFWPLNVRVVGERLGSAVPVPVRLAVWGLLVPLSVTVKVPLRVPLAVGVKVTLIVQLVPAATLTPQLFVCPKSPLLVPAKAMLVMPSTVLWELVSVTA
jgi:hypothetical protein